MDIVISGIGTALPEGWLNQTQAADAADRLRAFEDVESPAKRLQLLTILYRRSGVDKRHSVLLRPGDEHPVERQTFYEPTLERSDKGPSTKARMRRYETEAPILAAAACRAAMNESGCTAGDVRHLVTVSCSGFNAPGFDLQLYPLLGLSENCSRTHVGFMGCHGALNGLRVATALARSHPGERVLLCAVELCTLHHQYTDDPQEIVANSLFADGAAAAVITSKGDRDEVSIESLWQVDGQTSILLPESSEMMSWRIGDNGFQMTLSAQVPDFIRRELPARIDGWLAKHGLGRKDIGSWAVHPGGPRILSAAAEALQLPADALRVSTGVLKECGNMSSPTILFILKRLAAEVKTGAAQSPTVALAFGPGLVVEAALLR